MVDDHPVTAGVTLFIVMSYIIVANPLILTCAQDAVPGCRAFPIESRPICSPPASPVLTELVAGGQMKVVAGYYALATGQVTVLA